MWLRPARTERTRAGEEHGACVGLQMCDVGFCSQVTVWVIS